jgi:hypothetical protein
VQILIVHFNKPLDVPPSLDAPSRVLRGGKLNRINVSVTPIRRLTNFYVWIFERRVSGLMSVERRTPIRLTIKETTHGAGQERVAIAAIRG